MKKALVLSLVLVLGLGMAVFAEDLSGTWKTTLTINPIALPGPGVGTFLDFTSDLTVIYDIGGWTFTSFSSISDLGWTSQTFAAEGALGAFSFGSLLTFDPLAVSPDFFVSWNVTGGVSIAGMTFDADFTLTPGEVALILGGSGSTGVVDIDVEMTFGDLTLPGCDFNWTGVVITVDFPFCVCAEVAATLTFSCDGFVSATFGVTGIEIPNLPWVTIGALLTFLPDSKDVVLTPAFDFGVDVCFDLYISVDWDWTNTLRLGDIYIEGIGISCEIGGVEFTGITFWDNGPGTATVPAAPDLLGYYEMYKISTTETACCGDFDFDIAVYFDELGGSLFEVALFVANFSYELGDNFTFSLGFEYDVTFGLTLMTVGFLVTW